MVESEQPASVAVSVVEDHPMYRDSLCLMLKLTPGLRLVQAVGRVDDLAPHPPHVVLLDYWMPGVRGPDAVRLVNSAGHRVLVLSASERSEDVLSALQAGAAGYLSKSAEADQVRWALRAVAAGQTYVAPSLAGALVLERHRPGAPSTVQTLTERERSVLVLLARGNTDQQIARQLGVRISTVRSHLDNIREKTGQRRRAELTLLAVEQGLHELGGRDSGRRP